MTDRLTGRVAIVTGGARGIGAAISGGLAKAGAHVVVTDLDLPAARDNAERLAARGLQVAAESLDVTDPEAVGALIAATVARHGRIDLLVNNAGIMFRTRLPDIPLQEWQATMQVNLTGPFICTQAAIEPMRAAGFGRIVNMSSSAGRSVSTLGGAHYTASKAGLLGLTRAAAKELAPFGITVNAVCPGLIDTEMARATTTEDELSAFIDSFPVSRLGTPDEIAELVVFLCSEQAAYITGAAIDINGGDLMM